MGSAVAQAPRPPASEVSGVTDNFQRLKLTSFYVRPGFGTEGMPLHIYANFYQVRAKFGRGKIIQ
jgi:eukaryotic translation initiation factor 2C